jgi:hypothetical protein
MLHDQDTHAFQSALNRWQHHIGWVIEVAEQAELTTDLDDCTGALEDASPEVQLLIQHQLKLNAFGTPFFVAAADPVVE